MLTIKNIFNY